MKPENNIFGRIGSNGKPFTEYFNQMKLEVIRKFFDEANDDYTEEMTEELNKIRNLQNELSHVFSKINEQRQRNFPEDD